MLSKIAAVILITVFIFFFLSVIAPMHSQKKLWVMIRKIRELMDVSCYWFYILCAIATAIIAIYFIVKNFLHI